MQLNNEDLHIFFEGMKSSRENHAEENKSFEYGVNGRLLSRNGKLSYSSVKGTIEVYNNPKVVKYLGYFAFQDELAVMVKYDEKIEGENIIITNEVIFGEDVTINIPFGGVNFNFTNQLTANAEEQINTTTEQIYDEAEEVLINNYEEEVIGETIDLSDYYTLGSQNVANYQICEMSGTPDVPEYNQEYADAIIVFKKNNDRTLTPRIAWLGNMNWDINRKITTVGIYENNYYKRVYFTDNLNPLRVFNLKDNKLSFRRAEEFNVNQNSTLLQAEIDQITTNGQLRAMSVQYTYILITENGQVTPFAPHSELIKIVVDDDGYDFAGGDVEQITNKSVIVKCPIVSTLYKEIQCVAIEYEANTIPTAIRNLGKKDVAEIVYFEHTGNEDEYSEGFTLDDIISTDAIWTYCNDITTRRNRLIAAGLRNEPYALQEKYVEDMFLFKGWDVNGNTHNSLINPEPQTYNHFDPTNVENSIYLKKQLFNRFLFFGNVTLTFKNLNESDSAQSITFQSSSDEYIEYIDQVFDWLSGLDLTLFPNLQITRSNNNILLSPIDENIETDLSNYIFTTSVSQVIIDFQNEWALLEPTVDTSKLIYGAQSVGFNQGAGVRISYKEVKDAVMKASSELYESGPILDLYTPSLKKTFVKDEIYRCSIQFFKSGVPLFAIVLGDIKTPAIGDFKKYINNSGNPVISSTEKYTNQSEVFDLDENNENRITLYAHRIEMEVEVRIPCQFKSSVDSFQLQYVERTEKNRTVLAQGISAPLIRLTKFQYDSKSGAFYAPEVYNKWTLPFNGGPLYGLHGVISAYDNAGENWNDMALFNNDWDDNTAMIYRMTRREMVNRRMFYFDSPDIINGLISSKKVKNAIVQVLGRLNTDHTGRLIRARYPYANLGIGIHENYILELYGENYVDETHKELSFSRKIGYRQLGGGTNSKPYTVNISIFSKFTHNKSEHTIEKTSDLLSKGEIIPSAVLGTSFEAVNSALSLFAQHAYNSSLWLSGVYSSRNERYYSETGQSSNKSEGYPTIFIRANDDVFTNDLIGPHVTNPIYTKSHTWEGNAKVVNLDYQLGDQYNWLGIPSTDTHALINLKLNNENAVYGGRNKYAFSQNIFIPLSKVIPTKGATNTNQSQKFTVQGDFYTSLYLRTKNDHSNIHTPNQYTMYQDNNEGINSGNASIRDWQRGGAWAYGVILETEVESRLASDFRFYRNEGSADFSLAVNEFINSAYYKKNNLRTYNPVPWNFKDDPLLTNIISASKVKLNGDIFDAWTQFLLNEFYELEKAKGIITNITNWGDELYAIQHLETNKVNIDTSDFIVTESGQRVAVQKGTGQFFTSHDKISNFGTAIRRALAEGEFGFSFFDEFNKAFVKMAKPVSLEQELHQKLEELFENDRIIDTEGYYDNEYKETNIRIRTEKGNYYTLSYNELLNVFNGYIEYNNDIFIVFDKRVFAPITKTKKEIIECNEITSELTLQVNANEHFTYLIEATNNPDSFNVINLPSGLNFNPNTGLISGSISSTGTYEITIQATNLACVDTKTLVIEVVQLAPVIISPCFEPVQIGTVFGYQIVATNNPTTYNAINLPPGLTIDANGYISGTLPSSTGTWTITLTASNDFGTDTKECDLVLENVVINCGQAFNYSGESGSFSFLINLGTNLGECGINYNALGAPDRFRIEYNGVEVANSGYVGDNAFDAMLISQGVNPIDINTAPSPGNGAGSLTFVKTTAEPQFATIYVDAPLAGTEWQITGICPPENDTINVLTAFTNDCYSYWTIEIPVSPLNPRKLKFESVFAPSGVYSNSGTRGYIVVGNEITLDQELNLNTTRKFTFGIDGDSSTGTLQNSLIQVTLMTQDDIVLSTMTFNRQHQNNNC